jgi:hypothetical protein
MAKMATTKINKVPIEFTLDTGNAVATYFADAFDSLSVYGMVSYLPRILTRQYVAYKWLGSAMERAKGEMKLPLEFGKIPLFSFSYLEWKLLPYELNKDMPEGGMNKWEQYAKKFGSQEQGRQSRGIYDIAWEKVTLHVPHLTAVPGSISITYVPQRLSEMDSHIRMELFNPPSTHIGLFITHRKMGLLVQMSKFSIPCTNRILRKRNLLPVWRPL